MTKKLLGGMLKRPKRSAIINLSSVTERIPTSIYTASKSFDDFFSRSLSYETEDKIDVISIRPCTK
jgi:short-subunit dehydrogenase